MFKIIKIKNGEYEGVLATFNDKETAQKAIKTYAVQYGVELHKSAIFGTQEFVVTEENYIKLHSWLVFKGGRSIKQDTEWKIVEENE